MEVILPKRVQDRQNMSLLVRIGHWVKITLPFFRGHLGARGNSFGEWDSRRLLIPAIKVFADACRSTFQDDVTLITGAVISRVSDGAW
jgi:hypothetical protein